MTEALRSGLSSRSADCPRFKGWVLPTELLCELRDWRFWYGIPRLGRRYTGKRERAVTA
jgi:hypothetical protein